MDTKFYQTYFEVEKHHWLFRVRRNIILSFIKKYHVSKTATIFDFGCGSGYTVGYLQELGYNAFGVDNSSEAIKFGLSRGVHNIAIVQNGEINPPTGGADLILALDVIEHIKDDSEVIKALGRVLRPGGRLIITVPAYRWMWGVQDEVAHHFRRYTMSSLIKTINQSGNFAILKKSYFNTFLFVPIAAVRLFSRIVNLKQRESDFDINNKFLDRIFYAVFNTESKLLKYVNFPFGVSIVTILQKQ